MKDSCVYVGKLTCQLFRLLLLLTVLHSVALLFYFCFLLARLPVISSA